jgi:hypothetical protein
MVGDAKRSGNNERRDALIEVLRVISKMRE